MSRDADIKELGDLGEKIVMTVLESLGLQVMLSENKYDRVKDMMVEGETLEVKTHTPIKKFKAFCIEPSQWKKLDNVDRLFFVEVPDYGKPIMVYEAVEKNYFTNPFKGDIKRFYPLNKMRKFSVIRDADLERTLRNYSDSTYIIRGENDRAPFSTSSK
jgi:hypothetical protein